MGRHIYNCMNSTNFQGRENGICGLVASSSHSPSLATPTFPFSVSITPYRKLIKALNESKASHLCKYHLGLNFLVNSFSALQFTSHIIHNFKYTVQRVSVYSELCKHHYSQFYNTFITPQRIPKPFIITPSVPSSLLA
jgi:hypothetical protein